MTDIKTKTQLKRALKREEFLALARKTIPNLVILENYRDWATGVEKVTKKRTFMEIGVYETPIGVFDVYVMANCQRRFGLFEKRTFIEYTSMDDLLVTPKCKFIPLDE